MTENRTNGNSNLRLRWTADCRNHCLRYRGRRESRGPTPATSTAIATGSRRPCCCALQANVPVARQWTAEWAAAGRCSSQPETRCKWRINRASGGRIIVSTDQRWDAADAAVRPRTSCSDPR